MKIKDKNHRVKVDVAEKECPDRKCYWPRPDPGVFLPGRGYRQLSMPRGWLCGTREARGCPGKHCENGGK